MREVSASFRVNVHDCVTAIGVHFSVHLGVIVAVNMLANGEYYRMASGSASRNASDAGSSCGRPMSPVSEVPL